jgi:UDP-N-acetylmuramoyl-tripeptide--D-alanyl-D-alanine ligase
MNIEELYKKFLECSKVSTDTRNISGGELFFALKGASFDGNQYAQSAFELGAKYCVVDDAEIAKQNKAFIIVEDVLQALQQLAHFHRKKMNIPVIAITGSNGKTTTKELVHAVLSQKFKTAYTKGNLNNHIGIPLTLLEIQSSDEISIVEMGANHQKEIESYCIYTQPDFGLITNIGKAHLDGFGGIEGVLKGKTELYQFLKSHNGKVFVNADENRLVHAAQEINDIFYSSVDQNAYVYGVIENQSTFLSVKYEGITIQSNLTGNYNLYNILSAICIGKYFGVELEQIKTAIESYIPTNSRSQVVEKYDNKWILDAYNANPSSMEVALSNLALQDGERIAFLGAMKELGTYTHQEHEQIIQKAIALKIEQIVLVGKEFELLAKENNMIYFEDSEQARNWFWNQNIKNATILLKGSRLVALEKIFTPIA